MVLVKTREEILSSPRLNNNRGRFGGVLVIGGANIDLRGRPKGTLIGNTSNSGKIYIGLGGVGRNIAHNLALLNVPVTLISTVGDDGEGIRILEETGKAGVKMDQVIISEKYSTGRYLAILDSEGEMEVAVSDMQILEEITVDYLRSKAYLIKESKMVVVDTNIPEQSIQYVVEICNKVKVPIVVEPVSVEKAKKLRKVLDGSGRWVIDYITPNRDELESISGIEIDNDQDILRAVEELKCRGVKNVIVTLGERGIYVSSAGDYGGEGERLREVKRGRGKYLYGKRWSKFIKPYASEVVDVTGAGDALVAGLVYGVFWGYPLEMAARFGLAAAALTISSKDAVRRDLREGLLRSRIKEEDNK